MTAPVRIDEELFEAARATGRSQSRSAAQQISHWARIGRQLEASGTIDVRAVARVLAGADEYDRLDERSQAMVRAEWDEGVARRLAELDLATDFRTAGRGWIEGDDEGRVVSRGPSTQ